MNILVFTVASWNSRVGSNTWATLLEGYDPACVANICIRDEQPDSPVCSRYFCISENKVLRSVFKRGMSTGREVTPGQTSAAAEADLLAHNARYARMTVKRRYSMLLARELVWKLGRWKTRELDAFLDDFKPDIILHSMEGYIHLNRIIAYAIQRTGARAVGYVWDDNFTYKQSSDFGHRLYRWLQRRSLGKLAAMTDAFFAISPYTKQESDAHFGINCCLLTKPLNSMPVAQQYEQTSPLRMLYTGNLLIGRDKSLIRLVDALRKVNQDKTHIVLDVYTQTSLTQETIDRLQGDFCRIHAPIPQAEALRKQKEADILLFLEDIDGKYARAARLSFSTKITDYLSSGKCLLAIGNRDTAPIQYFMENDAALVCGSDEDISTNLRALCENRELLNRYVANACKTGIENHRPETIRATFRETLNAVHMAQARKGGTDANFAG